MLADGKYSSKFYFTGAQMLDKGEVNQNRPMAEGKTPLRQHGGQLGNFDGGFDWPAGELKP